MNHQVGRLRRDGANVAHGIGDGPESLLPALARLPQFEAGQTRLGGEVEFRLHTTDSQCDLQWMAGAEESNQ